MKQKQIEIIMKKVISFAIILFAFGLTLGFSQSILYKSNEVHNITEIVEGLSSEENIVLNLNLSGSTNICLYKKGKPAQCFSVGGSQLEMKGMIEKNGLIYVFTTLKLDGKRQVGIVTFNTERDQKITFKSHVIDGDLLFSYPTVSGLDILTLHKKKSILELLSIVENNLSTKVIIVEDKEAKSILNKYSFNYIDSTTTNFAFLSSENKAFKDNGKLILLVNKDEAPFTVTELKKIDLDFDTGKLNFSKFKLPLAPRTNHSSYLYKDCIYTLGLNSDYFSLSINDKNSFKALANLVYLKSSNKIDLKATPVYFVSGVPLADNNSWKRPAENKTEELSLSEILKKFKNEAIIVKPQTRGDMLQLLIGAYTANDAPSNWYGSRFTPGTTISTPGGMVTTPGYTGGGGGATKGTVDERRFFYGFLNQNGWTVTVSEPTGELIELKLEKRLKEIFEAEKVSGATLIIQDKNGYVVYILKKSGELVIEKIL